MIWSNFGTPQKDKRAFEVQIMWRTIEANISFGNFLAVQWSNESPNKEVGNGNKQYYKKDDLGLSPNIKKFINLHSLSLSTSDLLSTLLDMPS